MDENLVRGSEKPPLVSTVIPAYNHESFVEEAIRSVLDQSFRGLELIVINDGSTDGTDAVIRRVHRDTGERFRYVSKNNEGLVRTLNLGLQMARGKYFAQFGSDDVLLPDAVARQAERLESRPDLGLVCGDACYLEGRNRTDRRMLGSRGSRYFRSPDMYRELLLHNFIINMTVMYRRERLVEVGGFDENIPWFEDWDAVLRVAERHPIDYIDAPLGHYRLHPTNTHKRLDWMFEGIQATMEKHFRDGRLAHRRWFRRHVFCRIFYRYGKQLYGAGNAPKAVQSFKTALGYNPLYLRAYPKLMRAAWRGAARPGAGDPGPGPDPIW
jgi:alpha-1,3-rhamnosyltransferase